MKSFPIYSNEHQPFYALSVVNNKPDSEGTSYKVKRNNIWSNWRLLKADEHSNQELSKVIFELQYLDNSVHAIQFRNSNGPLDLDVSIYYPGNTPSVDANGSTEKKAAQGGGCNCPIPSIEGRLDWCPNGSCPEDPTPTPTQTTHLIVHHSAGSNSSTDWAAVVRSIYNFHTTTNGWDDVGYNFLIDPNGVIYEGRGNDRVGAHFSCMNGNAMGICLLGNFETAQPTAAMLDALTLLSGWKLCDITEQASTQSVHVPSDLNLFHVSGHLDGNSSTAPGSCASGTVCPGANLYPLLGSVRTNIDDYTTDCTLDENSDLVILSMDANPMFPEVGELTNLSVGIRNTGPVAVSNAFDVEWRIDGQTIHTETVPSIGAYSNISLSTDYTFVLVKDFSYCVFASSPNNELNSINNSFCVNVTVADTTTMTSISDNVTNEVFIYPNPVQNILNIESIENFQNIKIIDLSGKVVWESKFQTTLRLEFLARGQYILQLESETAIVARKLFIKE